MSRSILSEPKCSSSPGGHAEILRATRPMCFLGTKDYVVEYESGTVFVPDQLAWDRGHKFMTEEEMIGFRSTDEIKIIRVKIPPKTKRARTTPSKFFE